MVKNKTVQLLLVCFLTLISSCSNSEEDKYDLIPVQVGDRWGYINQSGEIVINPQFGTATLFSDGRAAVSLGGKYGFINDKGEYIISPTYKEVTSFSEGIAWTVKENGYPIAIDEKGKELFMLKEAITVGRFKDGLARFVVVDPSSESNTLYGYVDSKGKVAISPTFKFASDFSEGLAIVIIDDMCGFIDTKGKVVIAPTFSEVSEFSDGLAKVYIDDKCGFIDTKGKIVITPQFDDARKFIDGRCVVSVNHSYGVIDKKGKFIINPQFDSMGADDDLYNVSVGGKVGWCDDKGKLVINPQFESAGKFDSSDLAFVIIENKYGFIDKTGKIVINPQFERAYSFWGNISAVQIGAGKDKKCGFIDKKGIYVVNPQFSAVGDSEYHSVYSDYFNVETIISNLKNIVKDGVVDGVNFNTQLSDIMDRYSLKENDFKNYNSSHKLKTFPLSKDADLEFRIEGNMHNRVYSGWGYEDTLVRNATPKAFNCQITLKNNGLNKQDLLYAELKKAFKLDDNGVCKIGKSYLHFEVGYTDISLKITSNSIGVTNSESITENEVVIEVGEAIAYAGKVNGKHPITMNLTYGLDNLVSGTYQYTAYKLDISLEGTKSNGYMTLTESTNGKVTGTFSGQTTGGTYSGTWTSIDGKRTMPFSVTMK